MNHTEYRRFCFPIDTRIYKGGKSHHIFLSCTLLVLGREREFALLQLTYWKVYKRKNDDQRKNSAGYNKQLNWNFHQDVLIGWLKVHGYLIVWSVLHWTEIQLLIFLIPIEMMSSVTTRKDIVWEFVTIWWIEFHLPAIEEEIASSFHLAVENVKYLLPLIVLDLWL